MIRLRSLRRSGQVAAASLLAAGFGFLLRDLPGRVPEATASNALRDLDLYAQSRSFSEIEATRAELSGLALRFRQEAREKQMSSARSDTPGSTNRQAVIAELERGIIEFKDTPEELYLVQDLLLLLRAERRPDRWLDVYLETLYRQPTQETLASLVPVARRMAADTGRDAEVTAAIRHVLEIPLDFPAKRLLQESEAHVALSSPRPAPLL